MDAMPVTLGQEFGGYVAQLDANLVRIDQVLPGLYAAGEAAGFGGGDQLQGLLPLLAALGQELAGGEEHWAGQAGFSELSWGT